jgi:predicted RNA binding protein YcfA (HicA-like mRNA interferase family)
MKLPIISSDEVVRVLKKAGFAYAPKRGKGSHVAFYKETVERKLLVIIPKRKELPKGTLMAIIEQAGLTREEFLELLNN